MNGHQNEAFSCLIGALNNPRKVNGYGADYAILRDILDNTLSNTLSNILSNILGNILGNILDNILDNILSAILSITLGTAICWSHKCYHNKIAIDTPCRCSDTSLLASLHDAFHTRPPVLYIGRTIENISYKRIVWV